MKEEIVILLVCIGLNANSNLCWEAAGRWLVFTFIHVPAMMNSPVCKQRRFCLWFCTAASQPRGGKHWHVCYSGNPGSELKVIMFWVISVLQHFFETNAYIQEWPFFLKYLICLHKNSLSLDTNYLQLALLNQNRFEDCKLNDFFEVGVLNWSLARAQDVAGFLTSVIKSCHVQNPV